MFALRVALLVPLCVVSRVAFRAARRMDSSAATPEVPRSMGSAALMIIDNHDKQERPSELSKWPKIRIQTQDPRRDSPGLHANTVA